MTAGLTGGATIKVPFNELLVIGAPAPFDKSTLVSIIFRTTDVMTTHSFTIDNISFFY